MVIHVEINMLYINKKTPNEIVYSTACMLKSVLYNTQKEKTDELITIFEENMFTTTHWRKVFTSPKLYNNQNNETFQY